MKLQVPTRAEVKRANAGTCTDRAKLARKYGLSGAVARAVGLGAACSLRKRRR